MYHESKIVLTVHPPKALTRNHLEINALVPVFRINQVGKLDRIELAIQANKTSQSLEKEGDVANE